MAVLTHKDFFEAPNEKRKAVWDQLSEHEKFLVRCSALSSTDSRSIPCNTCKHKTKQVCKAFPEGITGEIVRRKVKNPYGECAHGIFYEKKEDTAVER